MKIVFMGTPAFAVPSLKMLVESGYDIRAVVTAADKPAGRGLRAKFSEVKEYALSRAIKILQPVNLKSAEFQAELRETGAELQVVVAFRMLPAAVWDMPRLGSVNLHASLLPDYRGAAPIQHAILNGEKVTGLTTFFIRQEVDTGNILFQEKIEIENEMTGGELHDIMMKQGADLVLKTVKAIESGTYQEIPQPSGGRHNAPRIFREDCRIHWNRPVRAIYDQIRALSPYPAAWTTFHDKELKLFSVAYENRKITDSPGSFHISGNRLAFTALDGYIFPAELQLAGKGKMKAEDFLRGIRSR